MKNIKVKMEKLIKISFITGNGTEKNPTRIVIQYWDKKGNLLFTTDPVN